MKLRKTWETRLSSPIYKGQIVEHGILLGWCDLTDAYWPGLFHCYSDPRIPATNNELERHIKRMKQLERVFSSHANPAMRFISHAATNSKVTALPIIPDEKALARHTTQDIRDATKRLKASRRKHGVAQRIRRTPKTFIEELLVRWKTACPPPKGAAIMTQPRSMGS